MIEIKEPRINDILPYKVTIVNQTINNEINPKQTFEIQNSTVSYSSPSQKSNVDSNSTKNKSLSSNTTDIQSLKITQ